MKLATQKILYVMDLVIENYCTIGTKSEDASDNKAHVFIKEKFPEELFDI